MADDMPHDGESKNGKIEPRPLIGAAKTAGYKPSAYASFPGWFSLGWGSFSLGNVDAMRRDPQINLCLGYRLAPIFTAQFQITADNPDEQTYVQETLKRFWQKSLPVAVESVAYGYSCSEVLYKYREGKIWFHALKPLHPKDCRPFTVRGLLHHVRINGVKSNAASESGYVDLLAATGDRPCEAFWLAHEPRYNPFYGRSALLPAWWYWRLKQMEDGLVESIFKWVYKHSISCTVIRHPQQSYDTSPSGGVGSLFTPAQDLAREMVINTKAGGVMAMPSDKDEHGDYLWKIEQWAEPKGNAEGLIEVVDWVDKQMQRGIMLPDELITHEGATGGYSRSMVAQTAFFTQCEQDLNHVLETLDEQILRPAVILNFGKATYKIEPLPLLPPDQSQPQPPPGMGQPGAQPPGQQPVPADNNAAPGAPLPWAQPPAQQQMSLHQRIDAWGDIVTHQAPHVRLVGSTSSGKTTMAKAIAASVDGKVYVIDPVATPGSWGELKPATVDADGNYGPIDAAIMGLLAEMKRRGAAMQQGHKEFERLTVIFDEVPDTVAELPNAGLMIRRIAQRGRHENIHLVGIGQSARVKSWGIAGYGDVAENFVTIYLGSKALEQDPSLAGQDHPGVLEWEGKYYQIDTSSAIDVSQQEIPASKQFQLPAAQLSTTDLAQLQVEALKPEPDSVIVTTSDAKAAKVLSDAIAKVEKLTSERVAPERAAAIAERLRVLVASQLVAAKQALPPQD